MKTTTSNKRQQGQTLIEILATLLIIAVGVIALIQFQNYLAYDNSLAQQKIDATLLAEKQIETQRDFQVLNNTTGYTSYQSIASATVTVTGTNTTYTVTSTVTPNTNPTYKVIDVTVSWTDRYNNAQSVRMVSYEAGIDPANSSAII